MNQLMSVRVMAWVWQHSEAASTARFVLLAIADCANDNGTEAYPSVATLATKTRLDQRTVQRSLVQLEKLGELRIDRDGPRGCNRYQVLMTPGTAPPRQSATLVTPPPGTAPPRQAATPGTVPPLPRQSATPGVAERQEGGGTAPPEPSFNHPGTKEPTTSSSELRSDVEEICLRLADAIEANGSKRPAVTARWRTDARLLLDKDGRTVEQVLKAIDWCQADPFWMTNILSMPKLREKYDQLRLAARRAGTAAARAAASTTDQRVAEGLALAAKLKRERLQTEQQKGLTG